MSSPLSLEVLPPNLRKHVDPASPKPLRGMAAKSLVPMGPQQLCTVLYMLSDDPEADIAAPARATAGALPDRILAVALRDTHLEPQTLDFFADAVADKEQYLEFIAMNTTTTDETVARILHRATARVCETVSQNQLRLLRHDGLLTALLENPNVSKATADSVADFAVRSGVTLPLPALDAARVRIFGAAPAVAQGPTAEQVAEAFAVKEEGVAPLEEGKKLTFTQELMKMNVSQKIKLAMLGNKEARTVLLRDSNKLVAMAAIQSPRITEGEVLMMANNKTAMADVLSYIYHSRDWTKSYQVKLALVKNPKVPLAVAMKYMGLLHETEVRELSRSKSVPGSIASAARQYMLKKEAKSKK